MKLSCPSCGAKYSIADEKVQDRLAKIRCRKCSSTIIVDGKVSPPSVYTSDAGSAPAADGGDGGGALAAGEYSVDFGDNDQRTMSADDIAQALRRGELTEDTFVWAEGMSDWQPIRAVPELSDALGDGAAPAAAAAAAAAPAARAAARSGGGRGSAHDLFGGIDKAGSEEDVLTSAPAPASPGGPAPTGARNESSVLFSLSALTSSATATSPSKPTATADAKGDDSGIIDLKALTSAAGSSAPASPIMGLPTAPLGMAAPLGGITAPAVASEVPAAKGGGHKTGLYVGGAVVLVGMMIAGAIVATSGNRDAATAASAAVPTAAATAAQPTAVATAEPKPEAPTAAPPATGTAATEAPKEEAPKTASAPKTTVRSTAKKASSSSSTSSSAAEKPKAEAAPAASDEEKPKKKKSSSCNCSPGDLMCAMKCAAGGK